MIAELRQRIKDLEDENEVLVKIIAESNTVEFTKSNYLN